MAVVAEVQARVKLKFGQELLAGGLVLQRQTAAEAFVTAPADLGDWTLALGTEAR